MTPEEELDRARYGPAPDMTRRAANKNRQAIKKAQEQAGPLFAEHVTAIVETTTPAAELAKWNQTKRYNAEDTGAGHTRMGKAIEWLRLYAIEHYASTIIEPALFAEVRAYVRKTYPMPDYGPSVWSDALTGKSRIPYRLHTEPMPNGLNRITKTDSFPETGPLMTREAFDTLFTIPTVEANDEGPDAALLEQFQAILARK